MSEGYVAKILDPARILNLLQHVPLVTGDLGKTAHPMATNRYTKDLLSKTSKNHAGPGGPATLNYEHVAASDRVSYFDMLVDPTPSPHLVLHLEEMRVSSSLIRGVISKSGKKLRPIFYLPYRQKGTTRMKLAEPPGYAGDEVQFFTTATIDGCSVYIEGSPATPKVSHLNASHVAPVPQSAETEANKLLRIQQKSSDMDARLNIIKKGTATVVERKDYIADTAAGQTQMKQLFANRKHVPSATVTDYQPFGAVVGLKSGGSWTFYLQKCGNFGYRPQAQGPLLNAMMVIEARECWPGGAGVFRMI
jgi:hypothetical protein